MVAPATIRELTRMDTIGHEDNVLLRGAAAIVADLQEAGVDMQLSAVYHALESGRIDASKQGRIWITTRRRARAAFRGEPPTGIVKTVKRSAIGATTA